MLYVHIDLNYKEIAQEDFINVMLAKLSICFEKIV